MLEKICGKLRFSGDSVFLPTCIKALVKSKSLAPTFDLGVAVSKLVVDMVWFEHVCKNNRLIHSL